MQRHISDLIERYPRDEIAALLDEPEAYGVLIADKYEDDPRNMLVLSPSSARLVLWSDGKWERTETITDEVGPAWIRQAWSAATNGGR